MKSERVIDFRKEQWRYSECGDHVFLRNILEVDYLDIEQEISCEKCSNGQRDSVGRFTMEGAFPLCFEKGAGAIHQQLRTEFNLHW